MCTVTRSVIIDKRRDTGQGPVVHATGRLQLWITEVIFAYGPAHYCTISYYIVTILIEAFRHQ